jgi:hypothetical protein
MTQNTFGPSDTGGLLQSRVHCHLAMRALQTAANPSTPATLLSGEDEKCNAPIGAVL